MKCPSKTDQTGQMHRLIWVFDGTHAKLYLLPSSPAKVSSYLPFATLGRTRWPSARRAHCCNLYLMLDTSSYIFFYFSSCRWQPSKWRSAELINFPNSLHVLDLINSPIKIDILSLFPLWEIFHVWFFFKINLLRTNFQEYHQSVKQFGSRSGPLKIVFVKADSVYKELLHSSRFSSISATAFTGSLDLCILKIPKWGTLAYSVDPDEMDWSTS